MAWLAIDKNGDEHIFSERPFIHRDMIYHGDYWQSGSGVVIDLPKGCIETILGLSLTWDDNAIEI